MLFSVAIYLFEAEYYKVPLNGRLCGRQLQIIIWKTIKFDESIRIVYKMF